MTQWGSKDLGDQGMDYESILKYFYGNNIVFSQANIVSGVPVSFPGFTLQLGSNNSYVRTIQNQLNAISNSYPAIEKVTEDGIFGPSTEASVKNSKKFSIYLKQELLILKHGMQFQEFMLLLTKIASLNPVI